MGRAVSDERLQEAIEDRFACPRCGNCCKGEGLVHCNSREIDAMAETLGLKRPDFIKQYAMAVKPGQWVLRDQLHEPYPGAHPETWCIFLFRDDQGFFGCRVNPAKPQQCRDFPYKWRNSDSLRSCAGLRALLRELRKELESEKGASTPTE